MASAAKCFPFFNYSLTATVVWFWEGILQVFRAVVQKTTVLHLEARPVRAARENQSCRLHNNKRKCATKLHRAQGDCKVVFLQCCKKKIPQSNS